MRWDNFRNSPSKSCSKSVGRSFRSPFLVRAPFRVSTLGPTVSGGVVNILNTQWTYDGPCLFVKALKDLQRANTNKCLRSGDNIHKISVQATPLVVSGEEHYQQDATKQSRLSLKYSDSCRASVTHAWPRVIPRGCSQSE